jgi:hypothetical protein
MMTQNNLKSLVMLFVFFYSPGAYLVVNFTNYEELAGGLLFLSFGIIFSYDKFVLDSKMLKTFADYI